MQILHLEDNPGDVELVASLLEQSATSCRIRHVESRPAFLEAVQGGGHDVILSDYSLPGFDGMEALLLARRYRPEVPFVFFSGSIGEDRAIEALRAGAVDYVLKENPKRLHSALQRAVSEARERHSLVVAQRALHLSETNFRTLFEQANDTIFSLADDGRITALNPAFEAILGWPRGRWIDRDFLPLVHPDDQDRARTFFAEVMRGAQRPAFELRINTVDGGTRTLEFTVTRNRSPDAQYSILGIGRDITERKQSVARIQEQAAALDKAPAAIVVTDLSHRVRYCNLTAQRLYGYTAEEMVGRTADELFSEETMRQLGPGRIVALATGTWQGEVPIHTRDGRSIIVEFSMSVLRDDQGSPRGRISIGLDITEKKQLQEQFFRAQRMENLGLLAAGIAHDLNNILAPALMVTPLLRARLQSNAEEKLLTLLEHSTERGAALVRQILSFAHGTGNERLVLQARHLMRDLGTMIEETFPRSLVFELVAPPDLFPVRANPTQLHQVLLNLCVNARDAMPNGGTLRLEGRNVTLTADEAAAIPDARVGNFLLLTVADSGTGIPPEVLARIWEPFFTTKGPSKGTGLGLSTVRGIVHGHGGFCRVLTRVGAGTTFEIYLPAAEEELVEEPATSTPLIPHGQGELVLIVDDEDFVRDLVSTVLLKHGFQTLTARDGAEALALYSARSADIRIVVTDRNMPNLGGAMLAQVLRRITPGLPLLMVSGVGESERGGDALPAGTRFLQKPFRHEDLLRHVHNLLHPPPVRP